MLPEGDRHIKRQHEIIAELGCNGHNTQLANLSGATRHLSSKIPPPDQHRRHSHGKHGASTAIMAGSCRNNARRRWRSTGGDWSAFSPHLRLELHSRLASICKLDAGDFEGALNRGNA
jgi:hypothetical protein